MATGFFSPTGAAPQQPTGGTPRRPDNLAQVFQEMLTAVVRLRFARPEGQVKDAEGFRANMKSALNNARQECLRKHYSPDYIDKACFAVVAFLDESVQDCATSNLVFAQWHGRLLQNEIFGHLVAGNVFFENLNVLLRERDSQELADLLEVHLLCLLLGYRGRYSLQDPGEFKNLLRELDERITTIRGPIPWSCPASVLPQDTRVPVVTGASLGPWLWVAMTSVVLTIILFAGFKIVLNLGLRSVGSL